MRISDAVVFELLQGSHKVNNQQLQNLLDQQKTEKKPLQELVIRGNVLSEKELTQLYAARIDVLPGG